MSIIRDLSAAKCIADDWYDTVWEAFRAYYKSEFGGCITAEWSLEDYVIRRHHISIYVTVDTGDCGDNVSFRYFKLPHEFFEDYCSEGCDV